MLKLSEKTHISELELTVLRCLSARLLSLAEVQAADISEIAYAVGIRDSDEVLRALYTLEGKSLVTPDPEGDFTSNNWRITDLGKRALYLLESNN